MGAVSHAHRGMNYYKANSLSHICRRQSLLFNALIFKDLSIDP